MKMEENTSPASHRGYMQKKPLCLLKRRVEEKTHQLSRFFQWSGDKVLSV